MLEARMQGRIEPLLAELHAHTVWSDGTMTTAELVDLYGRRGFDVLCVTDHVVRTDDPWSVAGSPALGIGEHDHGAYLEELDREAERALGTVWARRPSRSRADLQRPGPEPRQRTLSPSGLRFHSSPSTAGIADAIGNGPSGRRRDHRGAPV